MAERIRIGIIGCGRILPAHLRGYRLLREAGVDDFRITALVARDPADAHRFRKRGEGPAPRPPVSHNPADPLAAPHCYVSDFQPDVEAEVYASVEAMLAAGAVDAVDITATLPVHHTAGLACLAAGLVQLEPVVEGAYGNRATGGWTAYAHDGEVGGKGWIVAGAALMAAGGALALAAATRPRS